MVVFANADLSVHFGGIAPVPFCTDFTLLENLRKKEGTALTLSDFGFTKLIKGAVKALCNRVPMFVSVQNEAQAKLVNSVLLLQPCGLIPVSASVLLRHTNPQQSDITVKVLDSNRFAVYANRSKASKDALFTVAFTALPSVRLLKLPDDTQVALHGLFLLGKNRFAATIPLKSGVYELV